MSSSSIWSSCSRHAGGEGAQLVVGARFHLRLVTADDRGDRLQRLELAALAGVQDLVEESHGGSQCRGGLPASGRRRRHRRGGCVLGKISAVTVTPELDTEEDRSAERRAGDRPTEAERRALGWRDPVRWVLGAMVVGWSVLFIVLGWIRQAALRHVLVRPRASTTRRVWLLSRFHDPFVTVRGPRVLRPPRQPDPAPVRALLLARRRAAVPAVGPGRGAGVGRDRDLPARARPPPRPLAGGGAGRGAAAQPHVPVAHVGVLPSRRAGDRAAAVRVLGRAHRAVEVVRAVRGARGRVQGGRRARDRGDGRADRGARQPQDRVDHAGAPASPGTRSRPG